MTRFKHLLLLTSQTSINTNKGFPGSSAGKESTCNAGDLGLIPGLGRSLGEGNGYPLQYSGLEVAESRTQLSDFHFHIQTLSIFGASIFLI